ncbi:hypothetical protein [Streptacidiphilus sp. PAMC 29251]
MRPPSARPLRRTTRTLGTIVAAAGLTLAGVAAAAPVGASEPGYAALGDSYSSGVGAGSYLSSGGDCDRSTKSYPTCGRRRTARPRSPSRPARAPPRRTCSAGSWPG